MKAKHILILTAIIFTLSGCFREGFIFGVRGSGDLVTEEASIEPFSKVDLNIDGDLYLHQSDERKIVIEAQSNIIDVMKIRVRDGELRIGFKKNVRNHDGIYIHVYGPTFNGVEVSGAGNVYSETAITATSLDLKVSGSGSIELTDIDASFINTKISGSGSVMISGFDTVTEQEVKISGSGRLSSFGLDCNIVDVDISGSGKCEVHANDILKADISGSGTVYYTGNPSVSGDISGSGSIHSTN